MGDIKIKYLYDDNYNPVYVNGAHGGINPSGDMVINFYLERAPIPKSEIYNVAENGILNEQIDQDTGGTASVRFMTNGVVMNMETAKVIREWLSGWIDRAGEMHGNNDDANE